MYNYPEALFFDFDGVLVDSISIKKGAFRNLFEDYDRKLVDKIVAHHVKNGGISRIEKIQYFFKHMLKRPLSKERLKALALRYSEYVKGAVIKAPWISGAENFLKKYEGKIPMYIVSGTPQSELVDIVIQRKMDRYFVNIFGSPTLKTTHVLNIIDQKNLNNKRCYFIGDAMTDYNAAQGTGLNFIGIQGDNSFPAGTISLPDCTNLEQYICQ
jgi:phosphoglycolate phosphatase-like HAD superfamily hydrolase